MPKTLGFWEWGCIHGVQSWGPVLPKSQKQEDDWSPVGVVVPLDEGNAGSREKPKTDVAMNGFPLRMTISKDYTYISVPCYLIIAIKCIY